MKCGANLCYTELYNRFAKEGKPVIKRNQDLVNALNFLSDGLLTILSYFIALWLRFDVLKGRQSLQMDSPMTSSSRTRTTVRRTATSAVTSMMAVLWSCLLGTSAATTVRRPMSAAMTAAASVETTVVATSTREAETALTTVVEATRATLCQSTQSCLKTALRGLYSV